MGLIFDPCSLKVSSCAYFLGSVLRLGTEGLAGTAGLAEAGLLDAAGTLGLTPPMGAEGLADWGPVGLAGVGLTPGVDVDGLAGLEGI